jgi:hypothetical protein
MRQFLKKHAPWIDRNVNRVGYWQTFFAALLWPAMTGIAASIKPIAEIGWGAVVFTGLGVACIVALVVSACLVALRYHKSLPNSGTGEAGSEPKLAGIPLSQRLDNIDFTLLHLASRVVDDQIMQKALARMPMRQHDINLASTTNEALTSETQSLDDFVRSVGSNLANTRWWHDLAGELRSIEYRADQELRSIQIPATLNPLDYRLNHIARLHHDRVGRFLAEMLDTLRGNQGQTLNMIYQRKEVHKRS